MAWQQGARRHARQLACLAGFTTCLRQKSAAKLLRVVCHSVAEGVRPDRWQRRIKMSHQRRQRAQRCGVILGQPGLKADKIEQVSCVLPTGLLAQCAQVAGGGALRGSSRAGRVPSAEAAKSAARPANTPNSG